MFTLLLHDLAVAFKNKTFYLIIGIPLFVYATLVLVDPTKDNAQLRIALVQSETYAPALVGSLQANPDHVAIHWVADEPAAVALLRNRDVDGILIPESAEGERCVLTVNQQGAIESLVIQHTIAMLQAATQGGTPSWISREQALQTGSIQGQTMPTWILMMVLLVAFIVLPAQVAEEKEKQLLLGWLQAPVRERDWLTAKLLLGLILGFTAVLVLQMTGEAIAWTHAAGYLLLLGAGSFCFGALGICLGLLCRNQASARAIGLLCYLPLLLPAAFSDMSADLRRIAPWVPSHHFYEPLRAMLVENRAPGTYAVSWISLMVIGLLASLASLRLIRRRWLM